MIIVQLIECFSVENVLLIHIHLCSFGYMGKYLVSLWYYNVSYYLLQLFRCRLYSLFFVLSVLK